MLEVAVDWKHLIASGDREQMEMRNELEASQLHVPGIVLQLVKLKDVKRLDAALGNLFSDVAVDVVRVPRKQFVRIRREHGMFVSHAPHRYRASLTSALKSLGGEPLRKTADSGGILRSLTQLPTALAPLRSVSSADSTDEFIVERVAEMAASSVYF